MAKDSKKKTQQAKPAPKKATVKKATGKQAAARKPAKAALPLPAALLPPAALARAPKALRAAESRHLAPLNVPAFTGANIGHVANQLSLPVGAPVEMDADAGTIRLLQPLTGTMQA